MTEQHGRTTQRRPVAGGGPRSAAARRARRRGILTAGLALASQGGWDAVQMREVAAEAGVALGTLYRYVPSKVHLLLGGFQLELERVQDRLDRIIMPTSSERDRLVRAVNAVTRVMQRDPRLTEALTRALMSAGATAATEVDAVDRQLDVLFARALGDDEPSAKQREIARVVRDVWLASLVAWVTGRTTAAAMADRLHRTAALLLAPD